MGPKLNLSLRMGLYGGLAALYLCLVGMVETFGEREIITGVISLGHIMLLLVGLVIGYLTMQHVDSSINPQHLIERKPPGLIGAAHSLVAGIVIGAIIGVLMIVLDRFNIRDVLVNASPKLLELLLLNTGVTPTVLAVIPLGQGLAGGVLRCVALCAALGLAGGALYLLPTGIRRPVILGIALVAVLGLLSDLMRIALNQTGWPQNLYRLLYSGRGLSLRGAGIIIVITAAVANTWEKFPYLYDRAFRLLTTWLPQWSRVALASLLSVSFLIRLIWFLSIETVYPPLLPACPALKSGDINLPECTQLIVKGLGSRELGDGASIMSLAPAVLAATTLVELLVILGIASSMVFLTVQAIQRSIGAGKRHPAPPPNKLVQAKRTFSLYIGIATLLLMPGLIGVYPSEVLVMVGLYIVMGLGLNIVVGMAGLLDLGYVAFFAVGAYSMAVLTTVDPSVGGVQLSFWEALPLVVIITSIAGLVVGAPVLRIRGDYLAIVTLGFGEIARFLALSDWFKPVLGGAQGIIKIPDVHVAGGIELVGPQKLYYLILVSCLAAYFITARLKSSRVGRAWGAMREDEQVANVMGVNTTAYKLLAFAMGALIASVSGAIFAAKLGTIYPHSFKLEVSITALGLLIVGGIGSLPGVIVGAFALVGLPELLREFSEYRMLFYGAALVIMMLVRPQGLLPSNRRGRDIHKEERGQDDWLRIASDSKAAT